MNYINHKKTFSDDVYNEDPSQLSLGPHSCANSDCLGYIFTFLRVHGTSSQSQDGKRTQEFEPDVAKKHSDCVVIK